MTASESSKDLIIPALKKEKLGDTISDDLSNCLKKYLCSADRGVIAHKTGVGFHTVDKLIQGRNTLTKDNAPAIVEAINMAIDKCDVEISEAKEAKKKFKSALA